MAGRRKQIGTFYKNMPNNPDMLAFYSAGNDARAKNIAWTWIMTHKRPFVHASIFEMWKGAAAMKVYFQRHLLDCDSELHNGKKD